MRIGYTLLLTVLCLTTLSGCTWFTKGLDVCQDDACFERLAHERYERGDAAGAAAFCGGIQNEAKRDACTESITQKN